MKKPVLKNNGDIYTNVEHNELVVENAEATEATDIVIAGAYQSPSNNDFAQMHKHNVLVYQNFTASSPSSNIIQLDSVARGSNSVSNPVRDMYTWMTVRFISPITNTGSVDILIDSIGTPVTIKNEGGGSLGGGEIVAGEIVELLYNGTNFIMKVPSRPKAIVKFAVNDASIDSATGQLNFASKPSAKTLRIDGSVQPIEFTYYDGTGGKINTQQDFSTASYTNDTYVAIEEYVVGVIPNVKLSQITESNLPPSGGVNDDYWIQINPLKTYKKVSGIWQETKFVMFCQYATLNGNVGTVINYTLNGFYLSDLIPCPAGNTNTNFNHNIPSNYCSVHFYAVNILPLAGYTLGKRYEIDLNMELQFGILYYFNVKSIGILTATLSLKNRGMTYNIPPDLTVNSANNGPNIAQFNIQCEVKRSY